MFASNTIITNAGTTLIRNALNGDNLTFTRFKIGDGTLPDGTGAEELTDLVHAKLLFPITSKDDSTPEFLTVTGRYSSDNVEDDFRLRELGLFAKGSDNVEKLYFYIYDEAGAGTVRETGGAIMIDQEISIVISIGQAEHISVELEDGVLWASKRAFDEHVNDHNNPHEVTLEQVCAGGAILPVANGGTGGTTLTDLLSGLLNFVGRDTVSADDLNKTIAPGVYWVKEGTHTALPFIHKDNMAMNGVLIVFHTASALGTYNIHHWLTSDSVPNFDGGAGVPFGLTVEIIRRQANSAAIVDDAIPAADWSAWE